jgi:hypothetical protein
MQMTLNDISKIRLMSQKIALSEYKTAKEIVSWMGAMQAQDYSMAKWAIGVRLPDTTDKIIEAAIDKGEILRTHVLRPTWHFIPADDIYWMLGLSGIKIKSSFKTRDKELELSEPIISKSQLIIEKILSDVSGLTREEISAELTRAKIRTDENRLSHILVHAELVGLVCSGPIKEKKLTYSLLRDRVPVKKDISREEALARLAGKYFRSRCPATLEDFIWWSNLSVTDARNAVESVRNDFSPETIGSSKYWLPNTFQEKAAKKTSVYLLPAYDEFLIAYKDRNSSLSPLNNKRTVSVNGIFYPLIVVNGQVAGLWKRVTQKNKIIVTASFFQQPDEVINNIIAEKFNVFGHFTGKETIVNNTGYNK